MKYSCLLYSKWAWGAIGFLGFWGEIFLIENGLHCCRFFTDDLVFIFG
ncbi:hypothetical protein D931_01769 [Enterococcus faecium 13.SD.W.09]|nr:hypothetical protein D931_01769 [Enterococcus faecium 13.SD.W.09]